MKHQPLLLLCLTLLLTTTALAQEKESSNLTDIFPHPTIVGPSPTAASLGKFVDMPVAYYTGTPQVSVPLYEINTGSLSLPISLSYHGSGLKVEESNGWIGTNFALNVGGAITRSMRGLPDESQYGFFTIYETAQAINDKARTGFDYDTDLGVLNQFGEGLRDGEPDMFYFNFNGYSGRFYIDPATRKVHTIPYQKINITASYTTGVDAAIFSFIVTLPNGDVYYFGGPGYTETNSVLIANQENPPDYISSWYVRKIVSAQSSDEINFTYLEHNMQVETFASYTRSDVIPNLNNCTVGSEVSESSLTNNIYDAKKLESITFDKGSIKFISSRTVEGYPSARKLDAIEIKDAQNDVIKEFALDYKYLSGRLMLTSMTEKAGSLAKPPYQFIYNEVNVPPRETFAQDHWGYYNGKTSNTTLIPEMENGKHAIGSTPGILPGADRETDPDYLYGGSLTKLIYPTGGYTLFEYEPHQRQYTGITESKVQIGYVSMQARYDGDERQYQTDDISFQDDSQDVEIQVYIEHDDEEQREGYLDRPRVKIFEIGAENSTTRTYSQPQTLTYPMKKGKRYQIEASACCVEGSFAAIRVNVTRKTEGEITDYFGGLRIKKMTFSDGPDKSPNTVKRFGYDQEILLSFPIYNYEQTVYNTTSQIGEESCTSTVRTSRNQSALGASGSTMVYRKVTVTEEGPSSQGKTVYNYNYVPDFGAGGFPFAPVSMNEWQRGLLLERLVHDSANDTVTRMVNQYNDPYSNQENSHTLYGIKVGIRWTGSRLIPTDVNQGFYSDKFAIETTRYVSRWLYLEKTEEYDYGSEPTAGTLQKTVNYYYNNPEHGQLSRTVTTNSEGQEQTVTYQYAEDLENGLLKDRHMHSQVLEQTTTVDGTPTQKITTQYEAVASHVVPKIITNYPTGDSEAVQTEYEYDAYGNITQVLGPDGVPTSYIWGYNHTLPVAQIVGDSVATLDSKVATENIQTLDGDALRTELNKLRSLPDVQVTTYTHDPLVGITSETDPNGRKMIYHYDDLNRLQWIESEEGHVVQKFDYQYAQP